jgi:hypothetical protein
VGDAFTKSTKAWACFKERFLADEAMARETIRGRYTGVKELDRGHEAE